MELLPLYLSAKLATIATLILIAIAAPLAYLLTNSSWPGKSFVEALVNLPIALPPTVIGFYLLFILGPKGSVGMVWESLFGGPLLFTFTGIVIASIIYSLPFAIQPIKASFEKIDPRLKENAYVLGLSPAATFFRVIIPNSINGIAAAAILVFLHTMGAFGVVLMVGGSIAGETRVASIAIYEAVESMQYQKAWALSLAFIPISYCFLLLVNQLNEEIDMGLTAVLKKKTRFFSIDVELSCPDGETLALIGPSGSGKTTIIRMLAGLVTPDEGRIVYRDRVFFDSARGVNLSPQKRKLGYVFQDYSLFPHLTLYGNAAFAAQERRDVDSLMGFFGLTALRERKPHEVSGGERQRCAVCQALARNPQLLLLDEPFSALDVVTRRLLRNELKKITEKRTFPVVYVTHDVTEALFIGNTVLPIVAGSG